MSVHSRLFINHAGRIAALIASTLLLLEGLTVDHHRNTLIPSWCLACKQIHVHAHVATLHHLSKDDTFTAVILNDDVQIDLFAKRIARVVHQLVGSLVVIALLWGLSLYLQLEEVVGAHILHHSDARHVQLDVAIDHNEHAASWDGLLAGVLESVRILNIVAFLEYVVSL